MLRKYLVNRRETVDMVAAAVMLQSYLDAENRE